MALGSLLVKDTVCLVLTSEELVCLSPVQGLQRMKAAVRLRTCSECWWLGGLLLLSLGIKHTHMTLEIQL